MTIKVLDTLKGDLGPGRLLLGSTAAELVVETLDLVKLSGTSVLATGLLLTDLFGLSNEFLASLLRRTKLVLVLVGQGDINLGLDGVLLSEESMVSANSSFLPCLAYQTE